MMRDGKALQMGTSHEFGTNFARAFDIDFLDDSGARMPVHTTSWGVSTRMVGGLIMCHGDDAGLRLPPLLAPTQVVVTVVRASAEVDAAAAALVSKLAADGVRVELDDRVDVPFGRRAVDRELKGVPVRVELGPRDLGAGQATLVRRIPGTKEPVPLADAATAVQKALASDQQALYDEALARREDATVDVHTEAEAVEAAAAGWARIPWAALGPAGEQRLAGGGVTVRCLVRPDGSVPDADDEPDLVAVVARSY
jgi:prolyl-tRNA synthetase